MSSTTGHNLAVHGGFQGRFGGTWRGGVAWGRGLHGDVGRLVLRCVAVGLARRRCVAWRWTCVTWWQDLHGAAWRACVAAVGSGWAGGTVLHGGVTWRRLACRGDVV